MGKPHPIELRDLYGSLLTLLGIMTSYGKLPAPFAISTPKLLQGRRV